VEDRILLNPDADWRRVALASTSSGVALLIAALLAGEADWTIAWVIWLLASVGFAIGEYTRWPKRKPPE
jgi:hypothetical protein